MESKSNRLRRWTYRITAITIGLALGVVACELLLVFMKDPGQFYPYRKNTIKSFYPDEELATGVSGVSYFTSNSLGCRGPEPKNERHRVLVIGGSTAACSALDDSEAWPQLVMDYVNEKRGRDFLWVTNSGIDGKNSRHHLMHARYLVPKITDLDHVMVYCGLNDVGAWLYQTSFDPNYLDVEANWNETIAQSFRVSNYKSSNDPLFKQLEIWTKLSEFKDRYVTNRKRHEKENGIIVEDERMYWLAEQRKQRQAQSVRFVHRAKMETFDVALDSYGSNLQEIARLIRRAGAEPIFVAQAIRWKGLTEEQKKNLWMGAMDRGEYYVQEEQMQQFVDAYNQRMKEIAEQQNIPFIDLPNRLLAKQDIYYDGCHFNEKGARDVAQAISEFLFDRIYSPDAEIQETDG